MPNIVQQVFHVRVVGESFAVVVPPPTVFNVLVGSSSFEITSVDNTATFNVAMQDEAFDVTVAESIAYHVVVQLPGESGGGGGAVDSVFGRIGAVVAEVGDYDPQDLGQQGATLGQILVWNGTIWAPGAAGGAPVDSVFGRTGVVVAALGDYNTDQVTEGTNLYFTEARANAASDVVLNTTHRNLVAGNPHQVTLSDVGAAAAVHTHDLGALTQSGALLGQTIVWNGANWAPAAVAVESVNGQTGVVVLTTTNINEGTNLYYTEARVTANTTVAANAAHAALVAGNPHVVTLSDVGAAAAVHTHAVSDLTQSGATTGQVLAWSGLAWVPTAPGAAPVDSVFGRTGVVTAQVGDYSTAQVPEDINYLYYTDSRVAASAAVTFNTNHRNTITGNPHNVLASQITDFQTGVSGNADVAANTVDRHNHTNKAQLDLVTDGDHDVRVDNPHGVTPAQVGLNTTDDLTEGTTNLYFQEAPNDGGSYARKNLAWAQVTSGAALPLGLGTWTYSSTTTTPPASGEIRFDNASPALATKMYVNETDADGVNKGSVLARIYEAGAELYLQDRADKTDYWLGDVSTATDQGTWIEVDVTNVSLTGTFTNGEEIVQVLLAQAATTAPVTSVFGRTDVVIAQANDYTWAQIDKTISSLADITTRSHTLLTDIGTYNHAAIDSHINTVTGNPHMVTAVEAGAAPTIHTHPLTALEQSGGAMNDGIYWNGTIWTAGTLPAILAAKEPTGFVDRADSTISFVDATRTFTITPTGAQFEIWQQGKQYIITSADSIVISDTTGPHFVYYDEGILKTTTIYTNDLIAKFGYIAYLYWNSAQGEALLIGDERHGLVMSSATHQYLHLTRGAVIEEGFGLGNFTTDASGDLDIHAQFAAVAGIYWDEDIEIDIAALPFPANIPVIFLTGSGIWNRDTATSFPVKNFVGGSGRLAWNEFTGGVWTQTEATNNDFVLCHIFATNDPNEPYVAIQGQDEYDNLGLARAGAIVELGNLTDPTGAVITPELIAIGTVIYQTSNGYTNGAKARVRTTDEGTDYIPWTGGADTLQYGTPPQSHTNLLDIGLNTHPQIDTHIADITTNPHGVTFTQAVTADAGTDITAAEAEILTDGSNADALHIHDHGATTGLADDDHLQYHTDARGDLRYAPIVHTHVVSAITNWSTFNETIAGVVVNGGVQDFPMTLISSDAAVGMHFQDGDGTGDFYFAGAGGANGRWYFRDNLDTILMRIDDENVTIDDLMHIPYVTKVINSRGPNNVISNAGGDYGYNYNFTSFDWDPDVVYNEGGFASFGRTSASATVFNDELLSVDPAKTYEMSYWAVAADTQQHYGGITCFDADGLEILPIYTMRFANTDTTLAAALNNGDTTITLTDATNWKGKDGTTGIVSFQRAFTLYGYTNSFGHTYADYTYSRNHSGVAAWDDTGTEFTGNVLTLSTTEFPTGWQGGSFPVGTAISNASAGSTYKYIAASAINLTTAWSQHTGQVGGVDLTGLNVLNKFQPGTASVRLLFLLNRTSASTSWIFQPYFGQPEFDITAIDGAIQNDLIFDGNLTFNGTITGIDAADVSAIPATTGAFTDTFTETTTPPGTSMVATEAVAGSMRWAKLSNLPISDATQTALDAKGSKRKTHTLYIKNPTAADSVPVGDFPVASTIIEVRTFCDVGSITFNMNERAVTTPGTVGTDIVTGGAGAMLAYTTSYLNSTFSNDSMAAGAWLHYECAVITGTPTELWISVVYEEDV